MISEMLLSFALVISGGYITYLHWKKKKAAFFFSVHLQYLFNHAQYLKGTVDYLDKIIGEKELDPLIATKIIILSVDIEDKANRIIEELEGQKNVKLA